MVVPLGLRKFATFLYHTYSNLEGPVLSFLFCSNKLKIKIIPTE
jgi:hypothetical protein